MTERERFNRLITKYPHPHVNFFERPQWTRRNFFRLLGSGLTGYFLSGPALLFGVFLDVEWGPALPAALGVALLGATGLSALGSLLSAMSMFVRFRDFLFPILLFPLVLPLLVMASRMTETALEGGTISGVSWFVLVLYDWIFVWIGYFVFDYVLED